MTHINLPRIVLLILTLGVAGGCATDRGIIGQANQFHSTLQPAVITDRELDAYINQVGQRILRSAREYHQASGATGEASDWMFSTDTRFHLVNSETLNAFTTGGNHMYIYTELFRQSKTEDELAAVMAHEFAHVYGRHVHKGMNRQYAILGSAAAVGVAGYALGGEERGGQYAGLGAGAAAMVGQFVGMSYSRRDEAEADELGFEFHARAGWDPNRFGDFFQSMIEKGYDKGPEYLSGHPSLSNRLDAARKRAAALPPSARAWRQPPVASPSEFRRLQNRATEVGKNMPSDQTLTQAQHLLQAMNRSCITPAIHEDQQKAEQELMVQAEERKKPRRR